MIISCADVPDLGPLDDERIEIISGTYPVPNSFLEMALDKRAKKRAAGAEIGRRGGGYVMLVDGDDLVSARVVEHVLADHNQQGYYVDSGFVYYALSGKLEMLRNFYKKCGSCYVVHYAPEQLPASANHHGSLFEEFKNHRLARETALAYGITLAPMPFPAAVYMLETGETCRVIIQICGAGVPG